MTHRWIATMDRLVNAETQADCDTYMAAYEALYGVDSAPFWNQRYAGGVSDQGVELCQEAENH